MSGSDSSDRGTHLMWPRLRGPQVSLPMLAPLLLGTGMMFRTIRSNASLIFPRVGLLVVLLWVLWFVNSVVQNTVMYLRRQGAIDHRSVLAAFHCLCCMVVPNSGAAQMLGFGSLLCTHCQHKQQHVESCALAEQRRLDV